MREARIRAASLIGLDVGVVERSAIGLSPCEDRPVFSSCCLYATELVSSGRCAPSPADFGRGRRLGLYRARLALVGDRDNAWRGVRGRIGLPIGREW